MTGGDLDHERKGWLEALDRIVHERRSVRGFLPEPVPPETLRHVFELAQRAPSNCNVQPWRSYVASGAARDRIQRRQLARAQGPDVGAGSRHDLQ